MPEPSRRTPRVFTIGWVCALSIEFDAARAVLDEEYADNQQAASYILGRVGTHDVVIACPPAGHIGISAAAIVAERLKTTFPSVQYALLVGIGGGVPSSTADIRLGDVVISQPQGTYGGVVQYDFGKTGPGGRRIPTGSLNAPPQDLLVAVNKFRSDVNFGRSILPVATAEWSRHPSFSRPPVGSDVLFKAEYNHVTGPSCALCPREETVVRKLRPTNRVEVHYGLIGCGSQVIKDGVTRDSLSRDLGGILCFEMEAAGLMNNLPCLVIRGICDYADSHKNKRWQPFAAIAAAACGKEILSSIAPSPQVALTAFDNTDTQFKPLKFSPKDAITHMGEMTESEMTTYSHSYGEMHKAAGSTDTSMNKTSNEILFESLKFDQMEVRYFSVKPPHSETCRWVLGRQEFKDWLDLQKLREHNGFLWIKGKAATGKSTIMKFMLHHVQRKEQGSLVFAFFFNARGGSLEKSTLGLYRSLLYQLIQKRFDLMDALDDIPIPFNEAGIIEWDVQSLQLVFRLAIERLKQHPVIFFIDALDECDDQEVWDMVQFLREITAVAVSTDARLRILFSSRHYPHIPTDGGLSFILEDQKEHRQDIIAYIASELQAENSRKIQKIREEVLERSSGIFLWVVIVVGILNNEYRRGRVQAMEKRLTEVPNDIQQLFDDILNRGGSCPEETALCIQWVLYATSALTLEQLYFAVMSELDPEAGVAWDKEEITRQDMERFILDASRGLIEETKSKSGTVQFIHESVREFFLGGKGLVAPPFAPASTFPGRSHDRLKTCCSVYIQQAGATEELQRSTTALSQATAWKINQKDRARFVRQFPFLRHALRDVLYHSDAASGLGLDQNEFIGEFCFVEWFSLWNNFISDCDPDESPVEVNILSFSADQSLSNLMVAGVNRADIMASLPESYRFLLLAAFSSRDENYLHAILAQQSRTDTPLSSIPEGISLTHPGLPVAMWIFRELRQTVREMSLPQLLIWSIKTEYTPLLRILLAIPNARNVYQLSSESNALSVAVECGNVKATIMLIDRLANGDEMLVDLSFYALKLAVANGQFPISRLLLENYGSVFASVLAYSFAPLLPSAAMRGHTKIVDLFLELIPAFDTDDDDTTVTTNREYYHSALSLGAMNGHLGVVQLLLNKNVADINARDDDGDTPLLKAVKHRRFHVVDLLLRQDSIEADARDSNSDTALLHAAKWGSKEAIDLLSKRCDVDINAICGLQKTPLLWAAGLGRVEAVEVLLSNRRIDVNFPDRSSATPLSEAVEAGHIEVVKQLLSRRDTEVNVRNSNNETPLLQAARQGHIEIFNLLFHHRNIIVNMKDDLGRTPLLVAIEYGREDILRSLFSARDGTSLHSESEMPQNMLDMAISHSDDMVTTLIWNASANARDRVGNTILHQAVMSRHSGAVKILLARTDISINSTNQRLETPLVQSTKVNDVEIVRLLLECDDVDVNAGDRAGDAPLMIATHHGSTEIVKLLVDDSRIDVNVRNGDLETPLIRGCKMRQTEAVLLLLMHTKINIHMLDSQSRSASWWAAVRGLHVIADVLSAKGATAKITPYTAFQARYLNRVKRGERRRLPQPLDDDKHVSID